METFILPAFLSLFTIGIVLVFAVVSRRRTIKRMEDDNALKSSLAEDGPSHRRAD